MQILSCKKTATWWLQNGIWEGLGLDLGGSWGSLGRPLGTFGRFLVDFLLFWIELFSRMGPRWGPEGLLGRFLMDFRRFWEGFGKVLGRFWVIFGMVLGRFWKRFDIWGRPDFELELELACRGLAYFVRFLQGKAIFLLNPLCTSTTICLCQDPRVASLRTAERPNTRGFLTPTCVKPQLMLFE